MVPSQPADTEQQPWHQTEPVRFPHLLGNERIRRCRSLDNSRQSRLVAGIHKYPDRWLVLSQRCRMEEIIPLGFIAFAPYDPAVVQKASPRLSLRYNRRIVLDRAGR